MTSQEWAGVFGRLLFMISGILLAHAGGWAWYVGSLGCYLIAAGFDRYSRELQ